MNEKILTCESGVEVGEILTENEHTDTEETTAADEVTETEEVDEEIEENTEDATEEADDAAAVEAEPVETVESLRAELEALRTELLEKRAAFERMSNEINEFSELFPAVSLSGIPDSVWQDVKNGIPLSASYALYEKKTGLLIADAKRVNQKNSSLSTGPIGSECASDFFSPDEVRAMSRDEVRKNYSKIMESMKKWN